MAKLTGVTGDERSWNAIVTPLWGVRERGERERREEEEERKTEGVKKRGSGSINPLVMISY